MFDFNAQYFTKHQKTLLFIANKWYLRWFLGLNRLPKELKGIKIDKITPNSIHTIVSKKVNKKGKIKSIEVEAKFFSRPRFSEALAFNLTPFVYFQQLRSPKMSWQFSPIGALSCLVLFLLPKVSFIGFFGTTTSYYSGAGDGQVTTNYNSHSSWSSARDATSGDSAGYSGVGDTTSPFIDATWASGIGYAVGRAFFPIDTSGLGAGATITSANFYYYAYFKDWHTQLPNAHIVQMNQASTSALTTADYNKITFTSGGSFNGQNLTINQYNNTTLNATGLAWINKTGFTKLGITTDHDLSNTAPSSRNTSARLRFYPSEQAGTAQDPYLSVTYTIGNTSNFFQLF